MKFSIITATYNSDKTLIDNILSVNNQSYRHIEHLFIDNESTDNTLEIIESSSKRSTKVVSQKDDGMYFALNKGIDLAEGEIIGILNSDDKFFDSDIIKNVYDAFIKNDCDLVWGNVNIVKKDSNRIHRVYNANFNPIKCFEYGIMPPHPSIFIKKELYNKFGKFNTAYEIASDYDLILRLIRIEKVKTKYINKCFAEMKTGGKSSISINSFINLNLEINRINKIHFVDYSIWKFLIKIIIRMSERLNQTNIRNLVIEKFFKINKEQYA